MLALPASPALAQRVAFSVPATTLDRRRCGDPGPPAGVEIIEHRARSVARADPPAGQRQVEPGGGAFPPARRHRLPGASARAGDIGSCAPGLPGAAAGPRRSRPPRPAPEERERRRDRRRGEHAAWSRCFGYPGSLTSAARRRVPAPPGNGLSDIASSTPILQSTLLGPGRNKIFIRGVADSSFNGSTQSPTSVYFDDVQLNYSGRMRACGSTTSRSVEVLEGPQGTLYGSGGDRRGDPAHFQSGQRHRDFRLDDRRRDRDRTTASRGSIWPASSMCP